MPIAAHRRAFQWYANGIRMTGTHRPGGTYEHAIAGTGAQGHR
ncbi:hypothetical protein BIFDEN_00438 [Bifidobacterium dentium ATCC 27678]|nr:hypothetical protein BIFDEN_00438 [Bifidobacterium dentium ATCC 27678]